MYTKFKKAFFINIFVIFACCFAVITPYFTHMVQAEGEIKRYYFITQNTILIPQGQNIIGNIQLNSTYYVQETGKPDVTINDIPYKYVVYNNITGLVQSSALSKKVIGNVSNPFFISKNKLTIQTTEEYVLMFFNINDDETNCKKLQNNTKLDFLAYSENGKYILAKLLDGTTGYVSKNYCTPTIVYTPHPNPINPDTELSLPDLSTDNKDTTPTKDNKATITRIILIVTLCVVMVVVIFLLFKPIGRKQSTKDDFYDL